MSKVSFKSLQEKEMVDLKNVNGGNIPFTLSFTIAVDGLFNNNFWKPLFDGNPNTKPKVDEFDSPKVGINTMPKSGVSISIN